ncbi:hypothetical protein CN165_19295 [Sinorhizobium medicae]|nr:hypothetical protein CN165_19295 [Sinorhizobium medicae]
MTVPAHGYVVRWRLCDLTQWLWLEFGVSVSEQTQSRELRATIWMRSRTAARNDAPGDSHVASFILLPGRGEGGRAPRWQGFRSARPP